MYHQKARYGNYNRQFSPTAARDRRELIIRTVKNRGNHPSNLKTLIFSNPLVAGSFSLVAAHNECGRE